MNSKYKNSHSISETTRKVFFISNTNIKSPSSLFVPALITAKGLYPPSVILQKILLDTNNSKSNDIMIPRKSYSVPIKLITMQEHITSSISATTTTTTTTTITATATATATTTITTDIPLQKSQSTPTSPVTSNNNEPQIPKLISFEKSQINTAKSSRTPMKKWILKKKPIATKLQPAYLKEQEEEEDEPMTRPMSLTEKRKRQAKRADQVKIWKVREEREAREARLVIRRQMVNGNKKISQSASTSSTTSTIRKKKKRVKFNFDKNSIIQLPSLNDSLEDI